VKIKNKTMDEKNEHLHLTLGSPP